VESESLSIDRYIYREYHTAVYAIVPNVDLKQDPLYIIRCERRLAGNGEALRKGVCHESGGKLEISRCFLKFARTLNTEAISTMKLHLSQHMVVAVWLEQLLTKLWWHPVRFMA